jgi:hypothetical protein
MLRVWQSEQQGQNSLRLLLEDVHSGERYTFASIQALLVFLAEPDSPASEQAAQAAEGPVSELPWLDVGGLDPV